MSEEPRVESEAPETPMLNKGPLEELADVVCGLLDSRYASYELQSQVNLINDAIHSAAMREVGVEGWWLQDEANESDLRYDLYYATVSSLRMKVLMAAAQKQYYSREMKG